MVARVLTYRLLRRAYDTLATALRCPEPSRLAGTLPRARRSRLVQQWPRPPVAFILPAACRMQDHRSVGAAVGCARA